MPKKLAPAGGGGGITHRQARLVKILADPIQADMPTAEIADAIGVSTRTVNRWRNLPQVQEAVRKGLEKYMQALRPYALACLKERMPKDTQALKLFFELDRQVVQRYEVAGPDGGPIRLAALAAYSEADLARLRDELKEG